MGSLRREATEKKVKFKGNKKVENTDPEDSQDNYNSFNNSFKKIGKTPKHEASFNLYNTESWVGVGGTGKCKEAKGLALNFDMQQMLK